MLIGYVRVSKADGSQSYDLQIDALRQTGVKEENIYKEKLSGKNTDRPELASCLRALRQGDVLIVWKLDRLGRSLKDLVSIVDEINERGVSFKVLSGHGASIDTSTPAGKMVFDIFSALSEYERELIRERTIAGLSAARARGKVGGRKFKLTKNQLRMVQLAIQDRNTNVTELCKELGITRAALYKYVSPQGEMRERGLKLMNINN